MKSTYLLLLVFVFSSLQVFPVNLKDAIANKQVAVQLSGSTYDSIPVELRSNGFIPEMQLTVSNLSNGPINLELDPGYMLQADEPGYQAMLLTQFVDLKLKPGEKQHNYLYAMCTEVTKSGPNASLHYKVADLANPALLEMAKFIAAKKYWIHGAQEAVWSLSDDAPIVSIVDKSPAIQTELQKKAADIKKLNLDALLAEYDKRKGGKLIEFNGCKLDRNIVFMVKDTAIVSVGFYDEQGKLIKAIFTDKLFKSGTHSIRYNPFPQKLTDTHYTVRLVKNGTVSREYNFMQ